jgi:Mg-chelatase subunit ChlD
MNTTVTYLRPTEAVVKVKTSDADVRIPTHFIVVLDLSESMNDNNKLRNVKQCLSLLIDFLQAGDYVSLVTFASDSEIKLSHIEASAANKATIQETIAALKTEGATNLSAGLTTTLSLFLSLPGSIRQLKTGILLLTDGHANRGITGEAALERIVQSLQSQLSGVSLSTIAYGTDHNASLMKLIAEQFQTSYSIVDSLEDAATSLGDVLGGLISTVCQNVYMTIPPGMTLLGKYKEVSTGRYLIGDILSNTETLYLLDIAEGAAGPVTLEGVELPSLTLFTQTATEVAAPTERQIDVELLRLRYRCSDLFRRIHDLGPAAYNSVPLETDIKAFAAAVQDPAYDGNELAAMLRTEVNALKAAMTPYTYTMDASQVLQHATFVALGRGTSQMTPSIGDPVEQTYISTMTSPYQNRTQRRVTMQMQAAASQPTAAGGS